MKKINIIKESKIFDEIIHRNKPYKYKDYINNFKDFIDEIKKENATDMVCIEEKNDKNYLEIKFRKKDDPNQIIISEKIYPLNIEYYLTRGSNNERLYQEPFSSYIPRKTINDKETLELFEREKISDCYYIDNIRYFNHQKKAFQKLKIYILSKYLN